MEFEPPIINLTNEMPPLESNTHFFMFYGSRVPSFSLTADIFSSVAFSRYNSTLTAIIIWAAAHVNVVKICPLVDHAPWSCDINAAFAPLEVKRFACRLPPANKVHFLSSIGQIWNKYHYSFERWNQGKSRPLRCCSTLYNRNWYGSLLRIETKLTWL